jgi:hypothetical protein
MKAVAAFPKLQWPAELTGASEGLAKEVRPLIITGAGDGTDRIFVATQPGTIHVWKNDPNVSEMTTFLDIRDRIHYAAPDENEEGFLGLAFHPKFKENGEFFVYYTNDYETEQDRKSIISRFRVSKDDPNKADPASEEIIMEIPQPFWNHNGGTIIFGPDGYIYIGLGDGGAGGDPHKNGQDLGALLGKMLRIDVDQQDEGLAYAIPKDNPFVGKDGARGEIWAYGIRNIWRMAFDRKTGDLWAGDVGQNIWEEIDIITKGGNYGLESPRGDASVRRSEDRRSWQRTAARPDRARLGVPPRRRQVDYGRQCLPWQGRAGAGGRLSLCRLRQRAYLGALVRQGCEAGDRESAHPKWKHAGHDLRRRRRRRGVLHDARRRNLEVRAVRQLNNGRSIRTSKLTTVDATAIRGAGA